MRLVNAWVVTLAAVSGSAVNGFQLSSMPRMTSSMQVSATMDPVTETSAPNGSMSYAEVNKLAYRGLQKQCKSMVGSSEKQIIL